MYVYQEARIFLILHFFHVFNSTIDYTNHMLNHIDVTFRWKRFSSTKFNSKRVYLNLPVRIYQSLTRKSFLRIAKRLLSRGPLGIVGYRVRGEISGGIFSLPITAVPEAKCRCWGTMMCRRWSPKEIARSCTAWNMRANDDNDNNTNNDNVGTIANAKRNLGNLNTAPFQLSRLFDNAVNRVDESFELLCKCLT